MDQVIEKLACEENLVTAKPNYWQVSTQSVVQRGQFLLKSKHLSDCKFIVGTIPQQLTFQAHKVFLAMSSPVFEAMFYGNIAEEKDFIEVNDVKPEAFKLLLKYIYTDNVTFSSYDIACEVWYSAKKYMLSHLVEKCVNYLLLNIFQHNVCAIYQFAKFFQEARLMKQCLVTIRTDTQRVLESSSWQEVEFSTIVTIFKEDSLNGNSEIELFSALERWAKQKCKELSETLEAKSLRPVIEDALFLIRFLTFTPEQFAEGPGVSDLLTENEKFAILMNLCSSKCNVAMPEKFSNSRLIRWKTPAVSKRGSLQKLRY